MCNFPLFQFLPRLPSKGLKYLFRYGNLSYQRKQMNENIEQMLIFLNGIIVFFKSLKHMSYLA